jgi:diketogulonate reductase-like aldo/keto reductase
MLPTQKLVSGKEIPQLGLGTWQLNGKKCVETVQKALESGYTHIDTAQVYENQREVGKAIAGFERKKLFITSKIWHSDLRSKSVESACNRILQELQTAFVDLLLIHWPNRSVPIRETLEAMNDLIKQKKAKSIGVSNFTIAHLREALETGFSISVNQTEFHPGLYQKELLDFCSQNKIVLTAYSPLGRKSLLNNRVIQSLAKKYEKTPSQICLRWGIQKGVVVIPKASNEQHLKENMQLFDWSLSEEDESVLDSLGNNNRLVNPGFAEFNKK